MTAQAVREAFAAEGLDASRYGLFCADPLEELYEAEPGRIESAPGEKPGDPLREIVIEPMMRMRPKLDASGQQMTRLGVRYDQLFAMALATLFTERV